MGWNPFFHDRTGLEGCRIAGYMRIGFALLFLIDRIVMQFNLELFFSPDGGLLPYRISGQNYELADYNQLTIFQLYPESMEFIKIVAWIGILEGLIVLLGATRYPRLHMFGLYVNIMSFQNHNCMMWDGEDNMFRMWVILFLFLPLDHCTIYDGFGFGSSSKQSSSSWPMWPFRIFQIEMFIIYTGASLGKLVVTSWQNGSAIYRLTYGIEDYPGIFNPDFIFARYGPLKLLCWSALVLEASCYILVWIPALRKLSVVLMISLHIGIDLSMNMHMFEWLSSLGWCVFLIQPAPAIPVKKKKKAKEDEKKPSVDAEAKSTKTPVGSFFQKALTNIFVASFIFTIAFDAIPYDDITPFLPKDLKPKWKEFAAKRKKLFDYHFDPYITPFGLSQGGDWGMYSNVHVELHDYRIDAKLANKTKVGNIWRSPDWFKMSNWERKFHSRLINYYDAVADNKAELLHLMELMTKAFLEQENIIVETLEFVRECRTHKLHKMTSSTGGFWDPVVKYPMSISYEDDIISVRVGDCQDALATDTCARLIKEQGCVSLLDKCRKSCLKDCSGSNFIVEYWHDSDSGAQDGFEDDDAVVEFYDDDSYEEADDDDEVYIPYTAEL
jgi:hypothetical protein